MIASYLQVEPLATFMEARHDIYLKRKAGRPGPWTDDPVLRAGRFCNIFRELDTVTIWIEEHIRQPYAHHPHLWFMLAMARYINWPPTLEKLIKLAEVDNIAAWPSHPRFDLGEKYIAQVPGGHGASSVTWALTQMAKEGKTYTGAYMIRAESNKKAEWYSWSKHKYLAEIVLGRLWEDRHDWAMFLEGGPGKCDGKLGEIDTCAQCADTDLCHHQQSLEDTWARFQAPRYIGWGPFMAYEAVTDMRHTRYLRNAPDLYTWANAGPGAIRGLNRLFLRGTKQSPPKDYTNDEMFDLMRKLNDLDTPEMNRVFGNPDEVSPRFEMRDIEHSLCEYDKYQRVTRSEGKMRSKYNWQEARDLTTEENQ